MNSSSLRVHQFAGLAPGPKLIVLGAVHGNETCGTRAIERVLGELDRGELRIERGVLTLVPVTNPLAYEQGTRMGDRNLNRRLMPTAEPREYEDRIANVLVPLLAAHEVLLDLHSFRSPGRPFVMRGPENNDGTLEPFTHAAAEGRFAAHLGPERIVEGWLGTETKTWTRTRNGRGSASALRADLGDAMRRSTKTVLVELRTRRPRGSSSDLRLPGRRSPVVLLAEIAGGYGAENYSAARINAERAWQSLTARPR